MMASAVLCIETGGAVAVVPVVAHPTVKVVAAMAATKDNCRSFINQDSSYARRPVELASAAVAS